MKFDFVDVLLSIWGGYRFQRFLYWLFFVDHPVRIVRLYDEAVNNLQQQVKEQNKKREVMEQHYADALKAKERMLCDLEIGMNLHRIQLRATEAENANLTEVLEDRDATIRAQDMTIAKRELVIREQEERILSLEIALEELKNKSKNEHPDKRIEALEGFVRFYERKCRDLEHLAGRAVNAPTPEQDEGFSPKNMPLI